MNISRQQLDQWAEQIDVDLIGVASPDHYREVPAQWNPMSILPDCKAIIVFAKSIPRSYFRGIEEGTMWMRANRYLPPRPAYDLCRIIEDCGYLTVPCSPMAAARWPDGVVFEEGKPAPNVTPDIWQAAQWAGLGEIGWHGLFLTPQFGVRQALGMVFTEAPITADEPFVSGTVCPGEDCLACVRACPAGALSATPAAASGRGEFVEETCKFCANGAFPDTSCASAPPNRLAAACARACMAELEDSGRVATSYHGAFRRRQPWAVGTFAG